MEESQNPAWLFWRPHGKIYTNVQNAETEPVRETPSTSPREEEMALGDRMVTGLSGKAWAQKSVPNPWASFTLRQPQAAKQKLARTATDTFSATK